VTQLRSPAQNSGRQNKQQAVRSVPEVATGQQSFTHICERKALCRWRRAEEDPWGSERAGRRDQPVLRSFLGWKDNRIRARTDRVQHLGHVIEV